MRLILTGEDVASCMISRSWRYFIDLGIEEVYLWN